MSGSFGFGGGISAILVPQICFLKSKKRGDHLFLFAIKMQPCSRDEVQMRQLSRAVMIFYVLETLLRRSIGQKHVYNFFKFFLAFLIPFKVSASNRNLRGEGGIICPTSFYESILAELYIYRKMLLVVSSEIPKRTMY